MIREVIVVLKMYQGVSEVVREKNSVKEKGQGCNDYEVSMIATKSDLFL